MINVITDKNPGTKIQTETFSVLLLEDNKGDVLLLREMLSEARQFRVIFAERLKVGIKLLNMERVDIILLDLNLPDSQGIKTLNMISGPANNIPIIVMTGLNDEEIAIDAMRKGAQDYLIKGQVDSNLLVRALRYAIERKRLEMDREKLIVELKAALAKIKTLRGLIPICSFCKKIRSDSGFWTQIEEYVRDHADVSFSHSICPECTKKEYPEIYDEDEENTFV